MKSSRALPTVSLAPSSSPPESVIVTVFTGGFGSVSAAFDPSGRLVRLALDGNPGRLAESVHEKWGIPVNIVSPAETNNPLAADEIQRYLDGEPVVFITQVRPVGLTPFTLDVLGMLMRVPYGVTRSYGDIALALGKPGAARAVGSACGRNPVALVIPCHRIVASNGIGGFGPDLGLKRRLLVHEGIHAYQQKR